MSTEILNLEDLKTGPDIALRMPDGTEHKMQHPTVQSFIDHVMMVEDLGPNAGLSKEMEFMITIILKAFPTLKEKEVRSWPLPYLEQINEFIQAKSGMIATQDENKVEEAEASGNGSTAT